MKKNTWEDGLMSNSTKKPKMNVKRYMDDFSGILHSTLSQRGMRQSLEDAVKMIKGTKNRKKKTILVGNGGSAAISEHMAIDLMKNAKLRAISISGSPQITTMSNDYGYDQVFSKSIEALADPGDVLIAISSGGTSENILNAVQTAKSMKMKVITLSGFEKDNPLRKSGDINMYVPSTAYGYVEIIHNLLLHYVNDQIIGKAIYKFR
jgi:D-sedoheptulose 7-phosphate isomerase